MTNLPTQITRLASEYCAHKCLDKESFYVAVEKLWLKEVKKIYWSGYDKGLKENEI